MSRVGFAVLLVAMLASPFIAGWVHRRRPPGALPPSVNVLFWLGHRLREPIEGRWHFMLYVADVLVAVAFGAFIGVLLTSESPHEAQMEHSTVLPRAARSWITAVVSIAMLITLLVATPRKLRPRPSSSEREPDGGGGSVRGAQS